ncbi:MAG: bacteriorhodopsin [Chloroflexota bacterium]
MESFENFYAYTPMEYFMVAHTLTLGFAVMLAALIYFVLTIRTVAPRFRISSILSVVVMVSAFLILFAQTTSWTNAFVLDDATGLYVKAAGADGFTNGYRYLNWLIDVPMLLFQILFVVDLTKERRVELRNWFWFSGTMMIVTGYIGQFFESANIDGAMGGGAAALASFLIWGTISTLFFFHVLYLMNKLIAESRENMSERASGVFGNIWWLFLVSWMLYPGGYLMPLLLPNAAGVVGRQLTYTVADVSSKVIYGILLTLAAQYRSEDEYDYKYDELTGAAAAAGD